MLQWNSKFSALVVLALLVAIAAADGFSAGINVITNFTW
jgi:hypothetical protein